MRRVIIREFDQLSEALSNFNAMFAFRIMNLCVKAEEVALLPVKVKVEGEMQNLEQCSLIKKKDDYTFIIIPKFDEDSSQIGFGIANAHPEFKQKVESTLVDVAQSDGSTKQVEAHYIEVTMPEVNDDRYDVLKEGVKLAYEDCKMRMEVANAKADAKFAEICEGEEEANIDIIKQERKKLNDQWYGQRDKLYEDKLKEIEEAHLRYISQNSSEESEFGPGYNVAKGMVMTE